VKEKANMIEELGYLEIASKLIGSSGGGDSSVNPVDREYKSLKTEITPVETNSAEFKIVQDYVKTTHASTHNNFSLKIKNLYRIDREGEDQKFKEFDNTDNHQLLWHGSRMTNFCGILSQGLRIAPPEAPVTGYMFGKGIYFADMVSKSANYCHANYQKPEGIALLCQVALGKPKEFLTAQSMLTSAPKGFDSTMGVGSTKPSKEVKLPIDSRCAVPMGPGVSTGTNGALLYNEFIVYKTSQVLMRYLVHFDFNFK